MCAGSHLMAPLHLIHTYPLWVGLPQKKLVEAQFSKGPGKIYSLKQARCERFEPRSHFKSRLSLTLKMTTAQVVETPTTLSTTKVLFRTTFTQTIKLNLRLKTGYVISESYPRHVIVIGVNESCIIPPTFFFLCCEGCSV